MTLRLVRLRPEIAAFRRWGYREKLLGPTIDDGYAWHALLKAVLGDLAPKPFVVRMRTPGDAEMLAYTASDTRLWQPLAQDSEALQALALDSLESRPFPSTFRPGDALSFEVRVRPIVRARSGRDQSREVDAAVHAHDRDPTITREAAYENWLSLELGRRGAAELLGAPRLVSFRRSQVLRKDRSGEQRRKTVEGPEALFRGQLAVRESGAFNALIERGLGRHRAFGFGCLLLAPAGALK